MDGFITHYRNAQCRNIGCNYVLPRSILHAQRSSPHNQWLEILSDGSLSGGWLANRRDHFMKYRLITRMILTCNLIWEPESYAEDLRWWTQTQIPLHLTENRELPWCRLCRHCHRRLPLWQFTESSLTKRLTICWHNCQCPKKYEGCQYLHIFCCILLR